MLLRKHKPIRLSGKKMAALRSLVMIRDGGECVECRSRYNLELSHNLPRSLGGEDTAENTAMRCRSCHRKRDLHGEPGHF